MYVYMHIYIYMYYITIFPYIPLFRTQPNQEKNCRLCAMAHRVVDLLAGSQGIRKLSYTSADHYCITVWISGIFSLWTWNLIVFMFIYSYYRRLISIFVEVDFTMWWCVYVPKKIHLKGGNRVFPKTQPVERPWRPFEQRAQRAG